MTDLASIIIALISLVIIWAIVSIPVWISAKVLALRRASFGRAMLVTAAGPIVYALVLIISTSFLSLAIGNQLSLITSLRVVLAFLAWIYVFKRGFETGWSPFAAGVMLYNLMSCQTFTHGLKSILDLHIFLLFCPHTILSRPRPTLLLQ